MEVFLRRRLQSECMKRMRKLAMGLAGETCHPGRKDSQYKGMGAEECLACSQQLTGVAGNTQE